MIETMRFSEISLPRRLLIVLVTMAVLVVAYWAAAWFFKAIPLWLASVLVAAMVAFGIIGVIYDNRVKRRLLKARRDR